MREGFMAASGAMLIGTGAVGRRRAFWEASTLFLERSGAAHPGRTCPAGLGCDCSCCPAAKTSRWFRSIPLFLLLAPACRSSRTLTSAATDHSRPPHQRLRCPPLHALPIARRPAPIAHHTPRYPLPAPCHHWIRWRMCETGDSPSADTLQKHPSRTHSTPDCDSLPQLTAGDRLTYQLTNKCVVLAVAVAVVSTSSAASAALMSTLLPISSHVR